jgi:cell division control protein 12
LLRKIFADQIKKEESRFRQLESRLFSDRDRLNKDLEIKHAQIKALEAELETLHFRKNYGQIRR